MGIIYESEEDYQRAFEKDFREKCKMINEQSKRIERTTIDGEWTYDELKDDIWSEAKKIFRDEGWINKHKGRAFKDNDLLHEEFIVEDICNRYDLIEVYDRAYEIHHNDKPMELGIHYFDELARAEVFKILNNNLVTG
jgi:hypothetical protein